MAALLSASIASAQPFAGGGAQMPDARQMSGVPLPMGDLPVGTVTVRTLGDTLNERSGPSTWYAIHGSYGNGARVGMISLDKALLDLVRKGMISPEEAMAKANRPETIRGGPGA